MSSSNLYRWFLSAYYFSKKNIYVSLRSWPRRGRLPFPYLLFRVNSNEELRGGSKTTPPSFVLFLVRHRICSDGVFLYIVSPAKKLFCDCIPGVWFMYS